MTRQAPGEAVRTGPMEEAAARRSAVADVASHLRLWPVAIAGLAADLWSKYAVFNGLHPDEIRTLVPHVLSIRRSVNPGALFGVGQGLAPVFIGASVLALMFVLYLFWQSSPCRRSLHVALGLILAGALGNLYDRTYHVADAIWEDTGSVSWRGLLGRRIVLTGILTGETATSWTLGSYPDGQGSRRVAKDESLSLGTTPVVRDFIKIEPKFGRLELWPWVFNLADAFLVIGVGVLLINFWLDRRPTAP